MPCTHPLKAWKIHGYELNGKTVVFTKPLNVPSHIFIEEIQVPCGQCIECRRKYAFDWALRMEAEASLHENNFFVTLTYDDEHLPYTEQGLPTLRYEDVQNFFKRLRNRLSVRIRYYLCGEYGDKTYRPHYHCIIYNLALDDIRRIGAKGDAQIYRSATLESAWTNGYVGIENVAFECYAYVSGYMMKKQKGATAEEELKGRAPPRSLMSRRPGIGHDWYKKFRSDVYPADILISRGKKVKPMRFYDKLLMAEDVEEYLKVKERRHENVKQLTDYQLFARDEIQKSKQKLYERSKL